MYLWRTAVPIRQQTDMHVVSMRVGLHIRDKLEANIANRDTAFFQRLALRALFKRFQILKMPAREGILACAMGTFSLAKQHRAILDNHHSDADLWLVMRHTLSYQSLRGTSLRSPSEPA